MATTFPAIPRAVGHFGLKDPRFQSLTFPMMVPAAVATAANVAYTAAQLLGGLITRNTGGVARTDTLPTAASLVSAIQGCMVNTSFETTIRNSGGGAFSVTLAVPAGGGVTIDTPSTVVIPVNNLGTYIVLFTNVTPGLEAYTFFSLGVVPF